MTINVSVLNAETTFRHLYAELQSDMPMLQAFLVQVQAPGTVDIVGQLVSTIADRIAHWLQLRTTPGIRAYAQIAMGSATLDWVAEYDALATAYGGIITAHRANFPKDANGNPIAVIIDPTTGKNVPASMTVAQFLPYVAPVQAALALMT